MAAKKKAKNPLYDGQVKCKCVDRVDKKLVEHNTKIVTTLFTGKVALQVMKADDSVRKKAMTMLASYCPFCGVPYPDVTPSGGVAK